MPNRPHYERLLSQIPERDEDESSIVQESYESELTEMLNPHRPFWYIFVLAIIVGGLQLAWCTEFSEGTPFLLSLGLSKHTLALVWIAGPLSGSVGQPIVGLLSDASTYTVGRRKPFIAGGCLATCFSLFYLSHSVDMIHFFKGGKMEDSKAATAPFAVFGVYLLDFSISAIQAASRAYIVDNVPKHQQQVANAFAAILIGGFNILGFGLGSTQLVNYFGFLGDTQFKVLAMIASLTLIAVTTFSCYIVNERDPNTDPLIKSEQEKQKRRLTRLIGAEEPFSATQQVKGLFMQIFSSMKRMSPQTKIICFSQFFAWIGYFPMLFYTTTYVGELHRYQFYKQRDPNLPPLTSNELSFLMEESTRRGSSALLAHSIVSFLVDLALPFLVKPMKQSEQSWWNVFRTRYFDWLTVKNSWLLGHGVFIFGTLMTFWISSPSVAILLFGLLGIPWGIALWAPFVLISEEISRVSEIKSKIHIDKHHPSEEHSITPESTQRYESYEHESGILLAIHNVFVSAPQVVSSLMSSVLFMLLSPSNNDNTQLDTSIGWVFRFGGLATLGSLYLTLKIKSNEELDADVFGESCQTI